MDNKQYQLEEAEFTCLFISQWPKPSAVATPNYKVIEYEEHGLSWAVPTWTGMRAVSKGKNERMDAGNKSRLVICQLLWELSSHENPFFYPI